MSADKRSLPLKPRCRVIVDNDWAGDPDGLVALAHHLLSPTNRVVAITSSFLNPVISTDRASAENGAELARQLVDLIGAAPRPAVHPGSELMFTPGSAASSSAASEAIIAEARREDALPLVVVWAGPLTNVASALDAAPDISTRLTLVCVGGALAAEGFEYNRDTDQAAAEFVLQQTTCCCSRSPWRPIDAVPTQPRNLNTTSRTAAQWARGCGIAISNRTFRNGFPSAAVWPLGDSPPLLITALSHESSTWIETQGPGQGLRRVYTEVDIRLLVGDMLAKLRLFAARG